MDYKQAIEFLESFIDYEKRAHSRVKNPFRLDRVEKLLGIVGSPHKKFRTVHIAGTNGKGSTAAMCASIFSEAGIKTGLYTSPHLETFRERITICGEMIGEEETSALAAVIKDAVSQLPPGTGRPSFFEIYTALAFAYFNQRNVGLAVIETGLGGRLDATNVITPEISILTTIGLDHQRELGDTVEEIAREKCGIIKNGIPVVTSCSEESALNVIREYSLRRGAPLTEVNLAGERKAPAPGSECFRVEKSANSRGGELFILHAGGDRKIKLQPPLPGRAQALNAAAAAAAALKLGVKEAQISSGLRKTIIGGRLQFIPGDPPLLLDGGHNPQAVKNLAEIISTVYGDYSVTLIFGTSKDKDYLKAAAEIFPAAGRIILTKSENPRAVQPEVLRRELGSGRELETAACLREALEAACSGRSARTLVCVAGSFFLVGEALSLLRGNPEFLKPADALRI